MNPQMKLITGHSLLELPAEASSPSVQGWKEVIDYQTLADGTLIPRQCRNPKHYRRCTDTQNPYSTAPTHPLQKAAHSLFIFNACAEGSTKTLMSAIQLLHRSNFGLLMQRSPYRLLVHLWDKRFGSQPLAPLEPLELGALESSKQEFI